MLPALAAGWAGRGLVIRRWWRARGRGCRGRMGGIAALGVRHAGDTP